MARAPPSEGSLPATESREADQELGEYKVEMKEAEKPGAPWYSVAEASAPSVPSSVRGRIGLMEADAEHISVIWKSSDDEGQGKVLLLGSAANAMAALDNTIPGWDITHVICVASRKNADSLRAHASGMMMTFSSLSLEKGAAEEKKKRKRVPRKAVLQDFLMADRLRPDEVIDLVTYIDEALGAIDAALSMPGRRDSLLPCAGEAANGTMRVSSEGDELSLDSPSSGSPADIAVNESDVEERMRAILINCDKGWNRSPTLVLAFLMRKGLTLREAYRLVLRARPYIDPLPNYRQALREYEAVLYRGSSTVMEDEPFAMHISQLLEAGDAQAQDLDGARRVREASIAALLAER